MFLEWGMVSLDIVYVGLLMSAHCLLHTYHRVVTLENGWTSDFLCTQWFEMSFIPHAKRHNTSGKPILLIYNGHGSHKADEMCRLALQHGVHLFCLPPHMTHHLQPLDVSMFGLLQSVWQEKCHDFMERTRKGVTLQDVVQVYMDV